MATWTELPKSGTSGNNFYLKIDPVHYLRIDNGGSNRLLVSPPSSGSGWTEQPKS